MLLDPKSLIEKRTAKLESARQELPASPGIALIWVGNDASTAAFIRVKERLAKKLGCQFFLHHFEAAENRQLEALIRGLNKRQDIQGIVLQLSLPGNLDQSALIETIEPKKDIDNLRGDAPYPSPTPTGIIDLLTANKINPAVRSTIILGDGLLVGRPLAELFRQNSWPFEQINSHAESQTDRIRQHDLLIACTGVVGLITPKMVNRKMVVVDGSGVDVDVKTIEPLVAAVTPAKGAVGPLTVSQLFANLLTSARSG